MHRPQFSRIPRDINVSLLQQALVVVIGVGMVGSQIAEGLARFAVGHLRVIDHDVYEWENTLRHALPVEYNGWNKAVALENWLPKQIEGLHVEAIARKIDMSVSDDEFDSWLAGADLIVAATDDRNAQRRIGRRALLNEVAAIFPAVYPNQGGGEVILQLGPEWPCFGCWDYFRNNTEQLRGVRALDLDAQPVIFHAEQLGLGYLDSGSKQDRLLRPERVGDPPQQLITLDSMGVPSFGTLTSRPKCPSCGGGGSGLAPLRREATIAWQEARRTRDDEPQPSTIPLPSQQPSVARPPIASTAPVPGAHLAGLLAIVLVIACAIAGIVALASKSSKASNSSVPLYGVPSLPTITLPPAQFAGTVVSITGKRDCSIQPERGEAEKMNVYCEGRDYMGDAWLYTKLSPYRPHCYSESGDGWTCRLIKNNVLIEGQGNRAEATAALIAIINALRSREIEGAEANND